MENVSPFPRSSSIQQSSVDLALDPQKERIKENQGKKRNRGLFKFAKGAAQLRKKS